MEEREKQEGVVARHSVACTQNKGTTNHHVSTSHTKSHITDARNPGESARHDHNNRFVLFAVIIDALKETLDDNSLNE
jgi:hypothetical protein